MVQRDGQSRDAARATRAGEAADPARVLEEPEDGWDEGRPTRADLFVGLLGAVPLTLLAGVFAMWVDRADQSSPLTRLVYPVALAAGCLGALGWTRVAAGRRGGIEFELTVVLLAVVVTLAVLSLLTAVPAILG